MFEPNGVHAPFFEQMPILWIIPKYKISACSIFIWAVDTGSEDPIGANVSYIFMEVVFYISDCYF